MRKLQITHLKQLLILLREIHPDLRLIAFVEHLSDADDLVIAVVDRLTQDRSDLELLVHVIDGLEPRLGVKFRYIDCLG